MFDLSSFLLGALVALGVLLAVMFATREPDQDTDLCAKKHNVYECKLIAVPVEAENGAK